MKSVIKAEDPSEHVYTCLQKMIKLIIKYVLCSTYLRHLMGYKTISNFTNINIDKITLFSNTLLFYIVHK